MDWVNILIGALAVVLGVVIGASVVMASVNKAQDEPKDDRVSNEDYLKLVMKFVDTRSALLMQKSPPPASTASDDYCGLPHEHKPHVFSKDKDNVLILVCDGNPTKER